MSKIIPTTHTDKNLYFLAVVAYLVANKTRLQIVDAYIELLQALYGTESTAGTYLYLYKLYADKSTRTNVISQQLTDIEDQIAAQLRKIYDDIPASVWNTQDRAVTNSKKGLTPEHTIPTERIKATCVLDVQSNRGGLITVSGRETEDSKRSSLPEGVSGMEIMYAVIVSTIRPQVGDFVGKVLTQCLSPANCTDHITFTKARGEFQIDAQLSGYLFVCWGRWIILNHPNLAGDWSERHELMITLG
jgi:hypothetical protein